MIKRMQALNELEFQSAGSGEEVFGKYRGVYVYIKLGIELDYREHPKDDPKTRYRFFRRCRVEYSETEEQSERGIYQYHETDVDIILYW